MDRTACVWLIRRSLGRDATFRFFGDPAKAPERAKLFDVAGARLFYVLLGSVSIAAMLVGLLFYRSFFTARDQLRTAAHEE